MTQAKRIVLNSGKTQAAPVRVKTVYMLGTEIVKTNSGTSIEESGPNALRHLQKNNYGASYAEVLDADTEQLLFSATAKLNRKGKWEVKGEYEWNPAETERKYGVSALFKKKKK